MKRAFLVLELRTPKVRDSLARQVPRPVVLVHVTSEWPLSQVFDGSQVFVRVAEASGDTFEEARCTLLGVHEAQVLLDAPWVPGAMCAADEDLVTARAATRRKERRS